MAWRAGHGMALGRERGVMLLAGDWGGDEKRDGEGGVEIGCASGSEIRTDASPMLKRVDDGSWRRTGPCESPIRQGK